MLYMNKEKVVIRTKKVNPLLVYKCEQCVRLLEERIADIPDVQTWASEVRVSRRWLCKSMKVLYGKPPKIILREMKYEKVVWLICDVGLEASCYSVAIDTRFVRAKGLTMFLSAHYDTNFTELKMMLLKEEAKYDFLWLNCVTK